ncbi:MAG TPA: PmoA family protein [Planctomycetota bacterium]|nr:PmoA family protein [Planctomycetota bacterium]
MSLEISIVPEKAIAVRRGRELVTASWFGPTTPRPYVYPFLGPGNVEVTRLGHPKDLIGHSHHRSIWIGHHDVGGVDFWGEHPRAGRIVQEKAEIVTAKGPTVAVRLTLSWRAPDGRELLRESRLLTAIDLLGDELALEIEIELQASSKEPVSLGVTNFGLLGIRVATTMRVEEGLGGRILNSQEAENESGCFGQHATWMDYSGPVPLAASRDSKPAETGVASSYPVPATIVGIACFDHPTNAPAAQDAPEKSGDGETGAESGGEAMWHVRDDGWMGPSLTRTRARTIRPDAPLRVRYRIESHAGRPSQARIDERYRRWRRQG